jgi:hypothetical protein
MDNRGQEELAQLLAEAQSIADRMHHAYRPLPQVAEGRDETGAVTVTVEDHGARVTRVAVAADWKSRIPAARLGMAVMEAVMSVQLGPLKDFFTSMQATEQPAPPAPPPHRPAAAGAIARLNWDDLGAMLNTAEKALDAVAMGARARPPSGAAGELAVGKSGNRRVEVTTHAGQVASVTVDEKWAETANRQQLSDSLRQAFDAAYAAASPPHGDGQGASLAAEVRSALSRIGITPPPQPGKDRET